MAKKIAACMLCFILALSVCIYAESIESNSDTAESSVQGDSQLQTPPEGMGGRMGGGGRMPGGMGGPPPRDGNMQPPEVANGENAQPPEAPNSNTNDAQAPQSPPVSDGSTDSQNADAAQNPENETGQRDFGGFHGGGRMPGGMGTDAQSIQENMAGASTDMTFAGFIKEYETPIVSIVLLILAFVFVIFYKRKNY